MPQGNYTLVLQPLRLMHNLEPVLCDRGSRCSEKPTRRNEGAAAACGDWTPSCSSRDPVQP